MLRIPVRNSDIQKPRGIMEKEQKTLEERAVKGGCEIRDNCNYPDKFADPLEKHLYVMHYCNNGRHTNCPELVKKSGEVKEEQTKKDRRQSGLLNNANRLAYDLYKWCGNILIYMR